MKTSGTVSASSSEKKPETAEDFLSFLTDEIHTVIAASSDDDGLPVTCAIDIMDSDETGLYFLTARERDSSTDLKSRSSYPSPESKTMTPCHPLQFL